MVEWGEFTDTATAAGSFSGRYHGDVDVVRRVGLLEWVDWIVVRRFREQWMLLLPPNFALIFGTIESFVRGREEIHCR